jgi:hypothetical protein
MSSQNSPNTLHAGVSLFKIATSADAMQAFIPAKTNILPETAQLSYEDFCLYIRNQGFAAKPSQEHFEEIKKRALSAAPYFLTDFLFLKGTPPTSLRPATIKWLNPTNVPKDLVRPGVPFAMIKHAVEATPGCTVFGQECALSMDKKEEEKKSKTISLHADFTENSQGEIQSKKAGQAVLQPDGKIDFFPFYTVRDLRAENIQKVDFPCNVNVKCDLQGGLLWSIQGDLLVEQFWSATGVFVYGNAVAKSGIQTNSSHDDNKAIHVLGNLEANFIQSSCLVVEGHVKVSKAILASRITISGNLECLGDPGKIAGSEIYMKKGTVHAKHVGSEKEKPTYIKFYNDEGSLGSKIADVCEGTRIQQRKTNTIVKFNQPWPPPASK